MTGSRAVCAVEIEKLECIIEIQSRFRFPVRYRLIFFRRFFYKEMTYIRKYIASIIGEMSKPCAMVHSRNPVVGFTQDFRWNRILVVECLRQDLRHLQIVSVDIRQMVAVTESETPDLRCMSHQCDPYDGAGINIIDEPGIACKIAHILCNPEHFRDFTQGTENSAGTDGV